MFRNLGPMEIALILLIIVLVFGAARLPELGRSLGKGIREFKQSIRDDGGTGEGAGRGEHPGGGNTEKKET